MNKKYEQMATFNMSIVRYYADKCGIVGMYDKFAGIFKSLDLSKSDLNLWKVIAAFSGNNEYENFCIVPEQYTNERLNNYTAYQLVKYKTPILIFKRINNDNCDWLMMMHITKPVLLCQYIDDVKYAYGLSDRRIPVRCYVL